MGEGEVCVAVVNDVGEMETEKVPQKRDHQWLTGDSDTEPFAKKQAKVGSDDVEVEPCARIQLEVALHSIEQKPCANKVPTEGLRDIELEHFVENHVKECSNEMEWQSSGKKQSEAPNNIGPEPSGEQPVKECLKEINEEHCDKNQEIEGLNDIEAEVSVEQPVTEGLSEVELEHCERKQTPEALNDIELDPVVEQIVKEPSNEIEHQSCANAQTVDSLNNTKLESCVEQPIKKFSNEMELEPCDSMQATKAGSEIELEPSVEQPVRERSNEMEVEVCGSKQTAEDSKDTVLEPYVQQSVKECMNEMSLEACGVMQTKQALNDELEPLFEAPVNAFPNEREPEPCATNQTTETLNDIELEPSVEQHVKHCSNELALEPSTKEVKEASNDDICSEVSNPNLSPHDNASSFQAISSQQVGELVIKDQVVCGDITSTCSVSSSSEGSSREEEHDTNDASGTVSTSHVVLEIPKHVSTSGVRKITFKFSKRKEDYDSQLSTSAAQPMSGSFDDGTHKLPRLTHLSGQGLHETTDSLIYPTNMEEMKSGKLIPDSYPTTVKRLLSTRILEGAKVKYISTAGELIGIVKDCGYLCGCATCNFSKILRAHEFEEHAGGKTRHPNNHIYLENGKPIYSIIQEMKTAPFSTVDEVIKEVAGSSVNEEFLQVWKASLQRNIDGAKIDNNYHMKLMSLYHSTTSCTSHPTEDCTSPDLYYRKSFSLEPQTYVKKTAKEHKRPPKKPRSYLSSTAVEPKRSAEGGHKKRDNDLHRLLFMPNGLPDGTDLAYYARGKKILDGYKQGNGIVCSHCDNEISPSQFEAHAGWAAKRQPYRHIYISDGLTLHDIALLLANGQSIATSNSDDMCAVCGDRGELVICNGCPRAFHAVCLGLEGVPNEDWHCPYCRDSLGSGKKTAAESRPIVIRLTRVVKGREYEAGGCVICRAHDFSVADFDDRTVMICDQCEKEYHVGCLRESGICDLKALPSEKWFCCNHCDVIHGSMQEVVSNGAALVSASVLSTINKKHMEKGVFDVAPNQIRWRILSGKSRYPEHLPLLSRAAAIFRECFDPIVAKSGRDLIPVMVYGRNISGQEFGGIYCVVLMAGSVVVSAGLLRIFGREVAELPLVATSRQNQGKGYFQALFSCIEELLLSVGVENLVLPAAEEAESIWTKKLGFRKMSDERYTQYSRDIQLTIFKGTSMLEKELRRPTD